MPEAFDVGRSVTAKSLTTQQELLDACSNILRANDWHLQKNVVLAPSPKGGFIRADIVALLPTTGRRIAVYPRWQASSGTAEEKLPFQLIKFEMARAIRPDCADEAYFVLEGAGWTWREFYLSGQLSKYLSPKISAHIIELSALGRIAESEDL